MATKIIKWVSLPVLLIGSMFTSSAASYELLLNCMICLGALLAVQRTVWAKQYFWAAGFVVIALIFSPFLLVVKIFLLMGFTCMGTLATLFAAYRTQPSPAA